MSVDPHVDNSVQDKPSLELQKQLEDAHVVLVAVLRYLPKAERQLVIDGAMRKVQELDAEREAQQTALTHL